MRSPFCGYNLAKCAALIVEDCHVIQTKFNQLVEEHVHTIGRFVPADKAYLSDIRVTNISKSFTHKMAAETSWYKYGTKFRRCHLMYWLGA